MKNIYIYNNISHLIRFSNKELYRKVKLTLIYHRLTGRTNDILNKIQCMRHSIIKDFIERER